MLCLFKNTKEKCPICLEEKKLITQCKICTDTRICKDCCLSLCEKGLCGKCPVCRQPNWKKTKKTQIIPISKINLLPRESKVINDIILENQNNMDKCKYILFSIAVCISHSVLIYVMGLFTLIIFTKKEDWKSDSALYWVSGFVGIVWVIIIWSPCCCGKWLNKVFCKKY